MMKGRQMLWLVFQNYQVDKASINIYKSEQLRSIKLGNNMPAFLNQWTEHIAQMDEKPSYGEVYSLFVTQVRNYKPC